jgi:hypothetical protein
MLQFVQSAVSKATLSNDSANVDFNFDANLGATSSHVPRQDHRIPADVVTSRSYHFLHNAVSVVPLRLLPSKRPMQSKGSNR